MLLSQLTHLAKPRQQSSYEDLSVCVCVRVIQFLVLLLKHRCLCPVSHNWCCGGNQTVIALFCAPLIFHRFCTTRLNAFLRSSPLWREHHDYQIFYSCRCRWVALSTQTIIIRIIRILIKKEIDHQDHGWL